MTLPYFHVDAFADQPFRGNRSGVCLLEKALDPDLMQQIARETNLPETSFILREGSRHRMQWFTPEVELPLCGHGTLAAAHILWEQGLLPHESAIVFDTLSGLLTVRYLPSGDSGDAGDKTGDRGWVELDFPAFANSPAQLPPELASLFPDPLVVLQSNDRFMVVLDGEERVSGFVPDFEKLRRHGVIITSRAATNSRFDFVSRYFGGPVGVPEDQVTGSAHCSLGPYWSQQLGKSDLLAYQSSPRGGVIKVRLEKDRALLAGRSITLIKGSFYL
jgi:PhzF family phenazine biosynthesis protein